MKTTVITIAAICAATYAVSSCGFNGNSASITSAGMYDAGDWNYLEKQTRRRARENGRVWVGDGIFRLFFRGFFTTFGEFSDTNLIWKG